MPFDLRLVDGDLAIDPFDIQVTEPGPESVAQRIMITLRTYRGEYFLNTEFGAPWYQTVFKKGVSKNLIDSQIRAVVSSVPGVIRILEYRSSINPTTRTLSLQFKAQVLDNIVFVEAASSDGEISIFARFTEDGVVRIIESGEERVVEEAP